MKETIKQTEPNLIIYGGSFDPPHQGHLEAVQGVSKIFKDADIYIVPSYSPVSAGKLFKKASLSFEERVKMCEIAFSSELINPKVHISLVEEKLAVPNFTLNTIKEFKKNNPDKSIALLIGSDQLQVFDRWFSPLEILDISSLIVVKRNYDQGFDFNEMISISKKILSKIYSLDLSKIDDSCTTSDYCMNPYHTVRINTDRTSVYLVDIDISEASSTNIRDYIQNNKNVPISWLSSNILDYIKDNNFYYSSYILNNNN